MKLILQVLTGIFVLLSIAIGISGCKKPLSFSKGDLAFSVDTLVFDTVFTTIGSTTQHFKIYNKENKTAKIEEIELVNGAASPFRINVDGVPGVKHTGLELEAKDSMYVFVEVTLSVNGQSLPLIVEDSIRFRTNGKDQYVKLAVWGQDAYFHHDDFNEGTWANDKPHVIYGRAYVDSAKSLTIPQDTKVHLHKGSMLFVYKGTLHVEGALDHEVIFQGDRLEEFYKDVAGQWYGIYFHEARSSSIDYAIIRNGSAGIHLFGNNENNSGYTLTLTNTQVLNHSDYGILLYSGGKLKAENCLIANNGVHAFFVLEGGDYNLTQCHLLGYGSSGQTPAVRIRNYYTADGVMTIGSINEGKIYNSVIYGNQDDEILFDTVSETGVTLNLDFRSCLVRYEEPSTNVMFQNILWNQNPQFTDLNEKDYHFSASGSPLNGGADPAFSTITDLDGNPRPPTGIDIGAYQID